MNQRLTALVLAVAASTGGSLQAEEPPPLWQTLTYAYDGAGNITAIGADNYRYDGIGRLKRATTAAGADHQELTYDAHGNLTLVSTVTSGAAFVNGYAIKAATNQLNGSCPAGVDVCFEGRYDAAGNQTRRDQNASLPDQYLWDALNMMREQTTLRQERYVYDANDERVLIIERPAGTDTRRRYTIRGAGNKVVRELVHEIASNRWTLANDYVHGNSAVIASFSGIDTTPDRHYHADHLGSTRLITDKDGFPVARHTYWPFGRETGASDRDRERIKFTGHERDSAPGSPGFDLDYMHARYYDPNVGRFLSVDTGELDPALPQAWNRYAYTLNNPLKAVDPDGRKTQLVFADPIPGSIRSGFGHVALAINGRVYSFGTNSTNGDSGKAWANMDWGASLDTYVEAESGRRQLTLTTLKISDEQEAKLQEYLKSHNPNLPINPGYNALTNNCATVTEAALIATGILPVPVEPSQLPIDVVAAVKSENLDGAVETTGKSRWRDMLDYAMSRFRDWF